MPVPANYRWLFYDPVLDESYRVPINPNRMTSPLREKSLDTVTNVFGRIRTRRIDPNAPYEWSFSGVIRDIDHHDALVTWMKKLNLITITDHLGREFQVLPQEINITEKRPSAQKPDKFDYEMTVLVFKRLS